ncbi:MAG: putative membrane protein YedE/YeeE [Saprospiraceae bacterium]|jgi:uncharacterized membrane protein YedE/YeeE
MIDFISQPWHWAISGALITLNMYLLLWLGQRFGISSSLETLCTIGGAGKRFSYFDKDWRAKSWQLIYILGGIIGGFIAVNFLQSPEAVDISQSTIDYLATVGVEKPSNSSIGGGIAPASLFNFETLFTLKGFLLMVVGGFLIGFGTRYAGGCTSGHAISGLSNMQLPSLVAVIGFFIGGLITTHLLLPIILSL